MAGRNKKRAKKQTSRKSIGKKKATKKTPQKRTAKKTTKKKTKGRKVSRSLSNQDSLWRAYKNLQTRIDEAWEKLQADVKRKATPQVITEHKNQLLLLLGECNYMARECMKSAGEQESSGNTTFNPIATDNNPFKNQP